MRLPSAIRSRRVFSSVAEVSSVTRPVARTVVSELFFFVSSFNWGPRITGLAAIAELLVAAFEVAFEVNPGCGFHLTDKKYINPSKSQAEVTPISGLS